MYEPDFVADPVPSNVRCGEKVPLHASIHLPVLTLV